MIELSDVSSVVDQGWPELNAVPPQKTSHVMLVVIGMASR
jgi:hypothetical protein